jgi:hypothetical protein
MGKAVCTSFGQVATRTQLESAFSRPNPSVQIFPPEYLGTYAFWKYGLFETYIFLIVLYTVKSEENITPIYEQKFWSKSSVFLPFVQIFALFGWILQKKLSIRLIFTSSSKISPICFHQNDSL